MTKKNETPPAVRDEERNAIEEVASIADVALLKRRLLDAWAGVGYHLAVTVAIIRRMEELGYQFSEEDEKRLPLLQLLRLVASGQVLLSLVVRYFTSHARLFGIARWLPVHDQERIVGDEPLRLMLESGDHRLVRPSEMCPAELDQAFDRREPKIRTDGEQLAWMRERREREAAAVGTVVEEEPVKLLRGKAVIVLGGRRLELSLRRLKAIVAQLEAGKR